MRITITFLFILSFLSSYGQSLKNLDPYAIQKLDFSNETKREWEIRSQTLHALSEGEKDWEDLTEEEERAINKYGEIYNDIWDIIGEACSWYCGGFVESIKSSSFLPQTGKFNYEASNAHDLSYETAWVEGVKGHGIGEYLEYTFAAENPRITEIIIVNGYVKDESIWKANSRVKQLKVYYNDKPLAIFNLKDVIAKQYFKLEGPLGYSNREDLEALKLEKDWTLRFEILEVYEGVKYSDTVITEIFFNGIDVH